MKYMLVSILALVSALGLVLFGGDSDQKAPVPAPGYSMKNCVNTFDPAKTEKTDAGYQYWFADRRLADGKTLKLSVVGPGQATHAPHRHVDDEFFFILEGTAEFYLDGERRVVGPNTSLYCPTWHEHGIRNAGKTELKYLVVKQYTVDPQ